MAQRNNWKLFEQLVADLQRELAPGAAVRHDERILGRHSGTLRQVDVAVRQQLGAVEILFIIDCKDLNRPVDVKHVEEVIGLAKDVRANKAAIVSAKGYSKAAKRLAVAKGVDLLRLIDGADHKWRAFASIPVLLKLSRVVTCSFRIASSSSLGIYQIPPNPRLTNVVHADGSARGNLLDLFAEAWNDARLPIEAGEYRDVAFVDGAYLMGSSGAVLCDMRANMEVSKTCYLDSVELSEARGFLNESTGHLTSKGFTAPLNIEKAVKTWPVIGDETSLAVAPVLTFDVSLEIPRWSEAWSPTP